MKKFLLLFIVIILIITNSQVLVFDLYAANVNTSQLEKQKEKTIDFLNKIELEAEESIGKLRNEEKDEKIKNKLQNKKEEINELIIDTKERINNEENEEKIEEIINEVENRIKLKVTSGTLYYTNIENNLDEAIKKDTVRKNKVLKTLQKSIENEKGYSLIISTKLLKDEIFDKYGIYDDNLKIKELYKKGEKNYYLFSFFEESILQEELFENISLGELPNNFLGEEIIKPEIFSIDTIDLNGENISKTRGIENYKSYNYFDFIVNNQNKIKVGIIDTGIQSNHPDLNENIIQGYNFIDNNIDSLDDQGHGTHVAGIIGSSINSQGIIGVNPFIELVPLKICDENGFCPNYGIIQAISYAEENNIDIINMSLGGLSNPVGNAICDSISSYSNNGGIAIVAAGNSNIDVSNFVPGGCIDAVTIGAVDESNQIASFSNYGDLVDIYAPGVNIYSSTINSSYKELSGTSMATPHITGIVSILKQYGINDNNEIEQLLKKYSQNNEKRLDTNGLFLEVFSNNNDGSIGDDIINNENINATIVPGLEFQEQTKRIIIEDNNEKPIINTELKVKNIDFGDFKDLDLSINSSDINSGNYEKIELNNIEEEEKKEKFNFSMENQYFDENGNKIKNDKDINDIENHTYTKGNGIEVGVDFNWKDLGKNDFEEKNKDKKNDKQNENKNSKDFKKNKNKDKEEDVDELIFETKKIIIPYKNDDLNISTQSINSVSEIYSASQIVEEAISDSRLTRCHNNNCGSYGYGIGYSGGVFNSGIRYTGINFSKDNALDYAKITLTNVPNSYWGFESTVEFELFGVLGEDKGNFVRNSNIPSYAKKTISSVDAMLMSNYQNLELDITPIISEIINQETWNDGDPINLVLFTKTFNNGYANDFINPILEIGAIEGIESSDGLAPEKPINFQIDELFPHKIKYSWNDLSVGDKQEDKFVIKDENDVIIFDNIWPDTRNIWEENLTPNTSYQRKICGINENGESCSDLITFDTPNNIYDLDLFVGENAEIVFPEDLSLFDIYSGNNNLFWLYNGNFLYEGNTLTISSRQKGDTIIYLREKSGQRRILYRINVSINLFEWEYTMIVGEIKDPGLSNSDLNISSNISVTLTSDDVVYAINPGTSDIVSSRNGREKSILHLTVIPVPDPVIIECDTLIGNTCHFSVTNGGYYYYQSAPLVGEISTGVDSFRVTGLTPGTVTIYIKSRYGDFVTHIFEVTVRSKPLQLLECNAPLGITCNTNWWGDVNEYTYSVSDTDILNLYLYRYTEGSYTYEKLEVVGKQEGIAEVYVYENGEHIATFTITVEPPVSPIHIESASISIHQSEKVNIPIIDGGGEYDEVSYDSNLISFNVDDIIDSEGNKNPGEITITGKLPGSTYPTFEDKYGQINGVSVTVKDTILDLTYPSTDGKLVMSAGDNNNEYISISEIVGGIASISISNDNVEAYTIYIDHFGEQIQVIKVVPKKSGETLLVVTDSEGNVDSVEIVVGGSSGDEEYSEDIITDEENNLINEELVQIEDELNELFSSLGIDITDDTINVNSYILRLLDEKKESSQVYIKYKTSFDKVDEKLKNLSPDTLSVLIKQFEEIKKLDKYKNIEFFINYIIASSKTFQLLNLEEYTGQEISDGEIVISEQLLLIDRVLMYKIMQYEEAPFLQTTFSPEYLNALIVGTKDQIEESSKYLVIEKDLFEDIVIGILEGYEILSNYNAIDEELSKGINTIIAVAEVVGEFDDSLSLAISLFPGIGEGFDIWTLCIGRDPITGEELTDFTTTLTVIGLASGVGSGKAARDLVNAGLEKIAKELGMSLDEVIEVAIAVAKDYKIVNIDDIVKLKDKISVDGFLKLIKRKAWDIESVKIIENLNYTKIEEINDGVKQYIIRGWTEDSIENIIKNPGKIGKSISNYNGLNNPATVFYNSNYEYIVIDDVTNYIIQISDKTNINWIIDSRIYDLTDF